MRSAEWRWLRAALVMRSKIVTKSRTAAGSSW
jgi:hypothetical protein